MKEEMIEVGLSSTVDYLGLFDDTVSALTSVQALIEKQHDGRLEAAHVTALLEIIGDNLEECITAWKIERKHTMNPAADISAEEINGDVVKGVQE